MARKLDKGTVREIRRLWNDGLSMQQIARRMDLVASVVSRIVRYESHADVDPELRITMREPDLGRREEPQLITRERKLEIWAMSEMLSAADIAETLGLSERLIRCILAFKPKES